MSSNKRPASDSQGSNGQDRKRAKVRDARTIAIPRRGGSAASGNTGLPATIEVEKFAQARSFEIMAIQRSMKLAQQAGAQRAFQSLPQHLRRRAASHNIRRLPVRLRAKAISETVKDAAKPKKKTRKMLGKKRAQYLKLDRSQILLARQRNKIWLETHLWHAKRMHMREIWGHRLAEKPTEKAFRASYRASVHGALVHDASYFQYLELKGVEGDLKLLFNELCDPTAVSPASKRYSTGTRELTTLFYSSSAGYPSNLIGPITIIWDTPSEFTSPDPSQLVYRQVLLRLHPSLARSVYHAVALAIEESFKLPERWKIGIIKYEKEFLTFEITGKRATEVAKAVLKPVLASDDATKAAWRKISSAAGPASVPNGMILGLSVYDPRLNFPPKLDKSNPSLVSITDVLQPSIQIAQVLPFWNSKERMKIRKPEFRKRDLDARRSELLIPGSKLQATDRDNRIPILLVQRTITPSTNGPCRTTERTNEMAGWTLIVPSGWGMAFWHSLVFSETRAGGLRERSQLAFEAGAARFPQDYPGTKSFFEYEIGREGEDRGFWERKPRAKRINYEKAGIAMPFRAGFEEILRGRTKQVEGETPSPWVIQSSIARLVFKLIQASIGSSTDDLEARSPKVMDRTSTSTAASSFACFIVVGHRHSSISSSPSSQQTILFQSALVRVKILPCNRGSPEELGLIYELSLRDWKEVKGKVEERGKKQSKVRSKPVDDEGGPEQLCDDPIPSAVVGRITTGNYSLKRGHGYAIGAIPLAIWIAINQRDVKYKTSSHLTNLILFRNRDGEIYRAARLELMES